MNPNQRFCELAGICWHELEFRRITGEVKHICTKCWEILPFFPNPDFAAEPWRVLEVMEKHPEGNLFFSWLMYGESGDAIDDDGIIEREYIKDRTGKLRDEAIRWMEGRKG